MFPCENLSRNRASSKRAGRLFVHEQIASVVDVSGRVPRAVVHVSRRRTRAHLAHSRERNGRNASEEASWSIANRSPVLERPVSSRTRRASSQRYRRARRYRLCPIINPSEVDRESRAAALVFRSGDIASRFLGYFVLLRVCSSPIASYRMYWL